MESDLKNLFNTAIFIAQSLFNRNKVSGSTSNLSFKYKDKVYITGSGVCFGLLKESDFAIITSQGDHVDGPLPSKEYPIHTMLYEEWTDINAVLHCHSTYTTLWSCLVHDEEKDIVPNYTPYLSMKVGDIGLVPYAKPGSTELFKLFRERISNAKAFVFQNHGSVVSGVTLLDAFYAQEELEESLKVSWNLMNLKDEILVNYIDKESIGI